LTIVAQNKKARYNYLFLELFESGIELRGSEVKSLRLGRVNITESYAREERNELFLINSHFAKYTNSSYMNHEETRPRKLLLNKREIRKIIGKLNKESLTLVPTKIFFNKKGFAKVEIALAKGKKDHDKREVDKKRSWEREKKKYK
jgi:SsrA-binding protein|tara:strand:+ start:11 stop:448 length:438 start_codon:yes stop_codon:yes gene_type:complete